ncbi:CHAT domain-containing protein [Fodinibius saliphilus]|uniref:CHAT domain-containing protein n=1 Tax=Fodinibius saliphilus TaxID=1920650 RepID=UPI0011082576|nr:CHAT domain-containing tetratricopeptide repeat protein [Fodinibius saliphilus]
MLLVILFSFFQIVAGSDSSELLHNSKQQAKHYAKQIENGINTDENLWALSLLASEKDELRDFIEQLNRKKNFHPSFDEVNKNFHQQLKKVVWHTGSVDLFIGLLLRTETIQRKKNLYTDFISRFTLPSTSNIQYEKLVQTIVQNKTIDRESLNPNKFVLPHFFLLFSSSQNDLLSKSYREKIIQSWNTSISDEKDLKKTLAQFSYFRTLYLEDQYSNTSSLYNTLINNKLFPNSSLKLRTFRLLDYSMYRLGFYDRNLEIARNITLPLADYLNRKKLKQQIKYSTGINLYNIGKIKAANKVYLEILKQIEKNNPPIKFSALYNNLALTHYKLGQYARYLDLQFQALETAKNKENYDHQIEILNNLFIYHRKTNDQENALAYLQTARKLAQKKNNSSDLGTLYMLNGSFYRKFRNDFQKAHIFFNKAEEHLSSSTDTKAYIELLNEQAETYSEQRKFKKAIEKQDKILKLAPNKNNPNFIEATINKALNYLNSEQKGKAGSLITEFKNKNLKLLDFEQIIKAKTIEANYLYLTGKPHKALAILNPALEQVIVRARSSADLKSGFWHIEDEYLDAFELAVSIYLKEDQPDKATQVLDQLKTINDSRYYQNPLVKSSLLNESELTQYKKLTKQLDANRKRLLTAPEDEQFQIRQRISKLNLKKRKLDKKLTRKEGSETVSIHKIQSQLSAREMIMHVTELKNKYYIAKISRSDVEMQTVSLDSTLRNLFSNSVTQVATHKTNLDSLYTVTKLLGINDIPGHIEQITIIPDSYLYQLPIDILPLAKPTHNYSYGEATYLIEKYNTQYLTSLDEVINKNNEPSNIQNPLSYVGYGVSEFNSYKEKKLVPLPFAQKEVTSIANRLTNLSEVQTFINQNSTKETFKRTAPKARILHMATHSSVSERDPMFSTMYMSKQQAAADTTFEDQIFAYELFELNLNSDMIMLNSCESGSGSYIQGTGVMGISRALRYAGAESLVLNLWSVNDMLASDFAVHFYEQLNEGKSKAEALQATKRYFLENKNASPHFWGPYMLIGDSQPIVRPDYNKNMALAGTFVFYFLLMVGLSYMAEQGIFFNNNGNKQHNI